MRIKNWPAFCLAVAALVVGGVGVVSGYQMFMPQSENPESVTATDQEPQDETQEPEIQEPETEPESAQTATAEGPRIEEETTMVFEYYDTTGALVSSREEEPAFFLLGLDREGLAEAYPDWELLVFSNQEAVLRRTVSAPADREFVVGVYEGRIAVFYWEAEQGNSLYQLTDIPVAALSQEERERLTAGIRVKGENALAQILEDYGS